MPNICQLDPDEMEKVRAIGVEFFNGRCSCAIYPDRPKFCKDGPWPNSRMPECGYFFTEKLGQLVRMGECRLCGKCCSLPRKEGDPFGVYDPRGKPCKNLIVK